MKLYEVPNNTWVKVLDNYQGPPGGAPTLKGTMLKFKKIDGMYGQCTNLNGSTVYLKAWAEVEEQNNEQV